MRRRPSSIAAACFSLIALAAPGVATAQEPTSSSVGIQDFSFGPETITVTPGSEVEWTNDGPSTHSATADDGSFNTGLLKPGESYTETFNQVGVYDYVCTLHSSMTGVVEVRSLGSSLNNGGTSTDPRGDAPEDEKDSKKRKGLPQTGSNLGLQILIGVGLLFAGGNSRRLIRPAFR